MKPKRFRTECITCGMAIITTSVSGKQHRERIYAKGWECHYGDSKSKSVTRGKCPRHTVTAFDQELQSHLSAEEGLRFLSERRHHEEETPVIPPSRFSYLENE